jgi:hypothetical protein
MKLITSILTASTLATSLHAQVISVEEYAVAAVVRNVTVEVPQAVPASYAFDRPGLERFIRAYIDSGASNSEAPILEVPFYAEQVDYFNHGLVDRAFIARDVHQYAARWPKRWLFIDGDIEMVMVNPNTARAKFITVFGAQNSKKAVNGTVESGLLIDLSGDKPAIISVKSRVLTRNENLARF